MIQNRSLLVSLLLLSLALLLPACRASRPLADLPDSRPALFPSHTLGQIRYQLAVVPDTIHSYDSRASIRFESPEMKESVSLHLRQQGADTVAVGISKVRIRVVRALVTPDSFFVYDVVRKDLYYNSTEVALELLKMPVTLGDVATNLLGTITPPAGRDWRVSADTAFYYISNDLTRELYVVDPRIWRVTEYELRNENGELVESRTFSRYDLFGSAYLPRRIVFSRPLDKQNFMLYHRSLKINPDNLDLSFRTSASAKRIVFE